MNNNRYILSFLVLAYAIILAHSFIPHKHAPLAGAEKRQINHHHHHDAGSHQHEHEEESQSTRHSSEDIFQFFQHTDATGNSFIESKRIQPVARQIKVTGAVFITESFLLPDIEGPPLVYFNKELYNRLPQAIPYFFPLKAPPADHV